MIMIIIISSNSSIWKEKLVPPLTTPPGHFLVPRYNVMQSITTDLPQMMHLGRSQCSVFVHTVRQVLIQLYIYYRGCS